MNPTAPRRVRARLSLTTVLLATLAALCLSSAFAAGARADGYDLRVEVIGAGTVNEYLWELAPTKRFHCSSPAKAGDWCGPSHYNSLDATIWLIASPPEPARGWSFDRWEITGDPIKQCDANNPVGDPRPANECSFGLPFTCLCNRQQTVKAYFKRDSAWPPTSISGGPANGSSTSATSATFNLSAGESASFQCSLNFAAYAPCNPSHTVNVGVGSQRLAVKATDAWGNTGPETVRTWTVTPPDNDGDGVSPPQDCNDNNPSIKPGAFDIPYNGVDEDCSGGDERDVDNDGFNGGPGGNDCNDNNAGIRPNAIDVPHNGIDEDCSGADDVDADNDGFNGGPGGPDCNDNSSAIKPGAVDIPLNGIDEDCSGGDDRDADNDGFDGGSGGTDCNDSNPNVNPDAEDIPLNGIDEDCADGDDRDADDDGYNGGTNGVDCDDAKRAINPGATDVPGNGVDEDCDGSDAQLRTETTTPTAQGPDDQAPGSGGADRTPPGLTFAAARQRAARAGAIVFRAGATEACTITATAKLGSKSLGTLKRPLAVGKAAKLRMKLTKAGLKALRRALRKRKGVTVTLVLTCVDSAGNAQGATEKVKVRR